MNLLFRSAPALALVFTLPLMAACAPTPQTPPAVEPPIQETLRVRTSVTDLDAFQAFIAKRPTPEALRAHYPGLLVVMPSDIATRELRGDNSRYFADIDAEGRVVGGKFQ